MKRIKLFILVAFTTTSSCFAMRVKTTTDGWMEKDIPQATTERHLTTGGVELIAPEITSMAIDSRKFKYVVTAGGPQCRTHAIDEDGRIYQWLEKGRPFDDD